MPRHLDATPQTCYTPKVNIQDRINTLASKVGTALGLSRLEAVEFGLRLASTVSQENCEGSVNPEQLLLAAYELEREVGGFTMDELIDHAFEGRAVFSVHKIKIFAAKLLEASGFERRQFRRGTKRPLLWHRPPDGGEESCPN